MKVKVGDPYGQVYTPEDAQIFSPRFAEATPKVSEVDYGMYGTADVCTLPEAKHTLWSAWVDLKPDGKPTFIAHQDGIPRPLTERFQRLVETQEQADQLNMQRALHNEPTQPDNEPIQSAKKKMRIS